MSKTERVIVVLLFVLFGAMIVGPPIYLAVRNPGTKHEKPVPPVILLDKDDQKPKPKIDEQKLEPKVWEEVFISNCRRNVLVEDGWSFLSTTTNRSFLEDMKKRIEENGFIVQVNPSEVEAIVRFKEMTIKPFQVHIQRENPDTIEWKKGEGFSLWYR